MHPELEELREFAKANGFTEELQLWDVTFWAERMRVSECTTLQLVGRSYWPLNVNLRAQEAKYDIKEEELRPYFPLPRVLEGLFSLAGR
jgi:oligopeptidase A